MSGLDYLGWQIGLTYCHPSPSGANYEYMINLLDEMAANNMNILSIMMQSYGNFDPRHDGYCWPVKNSKLIHYKDENATNSDENREFLTEIIEEAENRNIEIELFLNYGIWNHDKISQNYPESQIQQAKNGGVSGWLHCPDSPGAWALGLDEVLDLLQVYNHPNVRRYAFERLSYKSRNHCYCNYTKREFEESNLKKFSDWKIERMTSLLKKYISCIRNIRPDISIGLHSQGKKSWGHDPERFSAIGIDYLLPHTIQFKTSKRRLFKQWDYLAPNPCILHLCARDQPPNNYPIWIKTPKILKRVFRWIEQYKEKRGEHIKGLMFFNEPVVSEINKKLIYKFCNEIKKEND